MPIAQLYIIEGRTDEQKETLIQEVSEAMARSSGMNNAGQMVSGFEGGVRIMVDGNQKPLVQLGYMLTEVASLHLLEVAVGKAEELGIKATVAVVDPSGRLIAFVKMAGSFLVASELARKKAITAAGMGMDTVKLEALLGEERSRVLEGLTKSEHFTVIGGGVPLVRDDHVVGGIGVSGGSEDQDIECAQAAAQIVCTY